MDAIGSNMSNPDNFCLKWSNYQSHVLGVLVQLLEAESMVDVTLCTSSGEKLFAHKIVLCAASSYFENIFSEVDEHHPVVILCEIETRILRSILDFVYHGELNVHASQLTDVLQVAATLQIRGLTEVSDQLPLLVSSDFEAPPLTHVESSHGTGHNEGMPTFPEEIQSEVVVKPYHSDADTGTEVLSEVVYQNSSAIDKVHVQDQETCVSTAEDMVTSQIQSTSLPESVVENCINQNESWTMEPSTVGETQEHRKRKRRESCRKEYSEGQLTAALSDLRNGQLLKETASAHNIPRSTLYVRAKAEGIPITVTRQEHSGENVNAAVEAVNKGASLQQASEMYQIPKTVLWRRVKAAGAGGGRMSSRQQTYGATHWQAAVQALQEGQNLSRVSAQFRIPKTTLFREKTRLIETGKLPWTSLKKRDHHLHSLKHSRLKEAVAACKEGKMSQAMASITYQVPKTTIWRRLHEGIEQTSESSVKTIRSVEVTNTGAEEPASVAGTLPEQTQFTFIEGNGQLPVTYIVEEDFSTASLIM